MLWRPQRQTEVHRILCTACNRNGKRRLTAGTMGKEFWGGLLRSIRANAFA